MATLFPIDKTLREWIKQRPAEIKAMVKRWPPNRLYRLTTTNQLVTLHCYSLDGTVKVFVSPEHNAIDQPLLVFGIDPETLEECEIPAHCALMTRCH